MWWEWRGNDLCVRIYVQPGARVEKIDGLHGDALKVRLRACSRQGKANDALADLLAQWFGVPAGHISLLSGHHHRWKRWLVREPVHLPENIQGGDFTDD